MINCSQRMVYTFLWLVLVVGSGCAPSTVWVGYSPDLKREVKVQASGKKQAVVVDGEAGPSFQAIAPGGIVFSSDGQHMAYPALDDRHWKVVRDGEPGARYDGISELVFSPDGTQLAYGALHDSLWHIVSDDWISVPFDSLAPGSLQFRHDGQALAFAGWQGGHCRVHQNLSEETLTGPPFHWIFPARFADGCQLLHYVGHDEFGDHLMVGDTKVASASRIKQNLVKRHGHVVIYGELGEGQWRVVHNGQPGPWYSNIQDLGYREKTDEVVYIAQNDTSSTVVMGSVPGVSWSKIEELVLSPGGISVGWVAGNDAGESLVFIDGKLIGRHSWAGNLNLANGGLHYAYLADTQAGSTVITSEGATAFDLVVGGSLVLSSNGQHWGALAGDTGLQKLYLAMNSTLARREFSWNAYVAKVSQDPEDYLMPGINEDYFRTWVESAMALEP